MGQDEEKSVRLAKKKKKKRSKWKKENANIQSGNYGATK